MMHASVPCRYCGALFRQRLVVQVQVLAPAPALALAWVLGQLQGRHPHKSE